MAPWELKRGIRRTWGSIWGRWRVEAPRFIGDNIEQATKRKIAIARLCLSEERREADCETTGDLA
jgi:hypothetical protein